MLSIGRKFLASRILVSGAGEAADWWRVLALLAEGLGLASINILMTSPVPRIQPAVQASAGTSLGGSNTHTFRHSHIQK